MMKTYESDSYRCSKKKRTSNVMVHGRLITGNVAQTTILMNINNQYYLASGCVRLDKQDK